VVGWLGSLVVWLVRRSFSEGGWFGGVMRRLVLVLKWYRHTAASHRDLGAERR